MSAPFTRVLVANRGEIAIRIMTTVRQMGMVAIAVVTPADEGARHAAEADVVCDVPNYLDADAIIAAAVRSGADAIHPGYGFLSESVVLAQACAAAGITWVGPGERALELMGDKIAAKEHVAGLGVPVVPGVAETERTGDGRDAELIAHAQEVGYPLIVKPSAGGGGKGMQVVRAAEQLADAIAAARRVAAAAFADDTLLLERLVTAPRHIEAQVLADAHGTVQVLGLRECSLQRRHQKVIEEAPAPYPLGPSRQQIEQAAATIAASVDYVGAGTVEVLVNGDDESQWYFLEMNTRLQVEHPVTEEVTGIDIVAAQLRVAAGQPLGSDPIVETGHAIEARVYAERPERGFLPSTGTLQLVQPPHGVRIDSGVRTGGRVSADYDPMIAKVIAHGADRAQALQRLDAALAEFVILGVHTNIDYLRALLAAESVQDATADTTFLDRFEAPAEQEPPAQALGAAAAALAPTGDGTVWGSASGWRLGDHAPVAVPLLVGDDVVPTVPAASADWRTAVDGDTAWVWSAGHTWAISRQTRDDAVQASRRTRAGAAPDPQVRTPMPGTVVAVPVANGDAVTAGQVLVVVEAMKMENPVTAPVDGVVDLKITQGQTVAADQVVAVIHTASQ